MRPIPPGQAPTREQLLRAAGEVFADRGFHAATVREICQRAQANIAAVNYHFGDKEKLYRAVLHYAHSVALEKYPIQTANAHASPRDRLHAFVLAFLRRLLEPGPVAWRGRLLAREMVEPTAALDSLVHEEIKPQAAELAKIVRALLEPARPSDDVVRRCAFSIVSQCVFYHNCQPVIARLYPNAPADEHAITTLADHITEFTIGGLHAVARARRAKN